MVLKIHFKSNSSNLKKYCRKGEGEEERWSMVERRTAAAGGGEKLMVDGEFTTDVTGEKQKRNTFSLILSHIFFLSSFI